MTLLILSFLGGLLIAGVISFFSILAAVLRLVVDYLSPASSPAVRVPQVTSLQQVPSHRRDRIVLLLLASGIVGSLFRLFGLI
jgi:hypothetical protein